MTQSSLFCRAPPPNSCLLHKSLALSDDVMAFDINHACSGFVYSLGIAQGLAASGAASNILIVNSDTYSKYISIKDRTTRVLFGDAAAVTWVATAPGQPGSLLDVAFATSGEGYDSFIVPAGGCRNPRSAQTAVMSSDANGNERSLESIHMDGLSILNFAKTKVVDQIRFLCEKNHITLDSVDLFVPHQASKMALDSLQRLLQIPPSKVFVNLEKLGNTVSASIPIALKDAQDKGRIKSGDKVLISGFGAGLSWSSALLQY